MNQAIKSKINRALREISEIKQAIEWVYKHNLQNLPDVVRDAYITEGLAIKIPPGKENFKQMRRAIGKDWTRHYDFSNDDGDVFIGYYRRDEPITNLEFCPHLLVVVMAAYADGKQCKVKVIGTKEIEIRKIVCS